MATYFIVPKGTNPTSPFDTGTRLEWNADDDVTVVDGDILNFTGGVDDNVTVKPEAPATTASITSLFAEDSTGGGYDVTYTTGITADIDVTAGTDIGDVVIKAKDSSGVDLDAGDNVTIGPIEASDTFANDLNFGTNATVNGDIIGSIADDSVVFADGTDASTGPTINGDIDLKDGSNSLRVGDFGTVDGQIMGGDGQDIFVLGSDVTVTGVISLGKSPAGPSNDNILTVGDGSDIQGNVTSDSDSSNTINSGVDVTYGGSITGGDKDDAFSFGEGTQITGNIDLKNGDDTLNIDSTTANPSSVTEIKAADGKETITIGDGFSAKKIDIGNGGSEITIGSDLTLTEDIITKDGDDTITIGDGGSVRRIETGKDNDTVEVGNDFTVTEHVKMDDGSDSFIAGDNFSVAKNIELGSSIPAGTDPTTGEPIFDTATGYLELGSGSFVGGDIVGGDGRDDVILGDGTVVEGAIDLKKGDDFITLADNVVVDEIKQSSDGDATVTTGDNIYIRTMDLGGTDNDVANIGTYDRTEIAAQGADILLKGGEGNDGDGTQDIDSITLDFSWLTGYNADPALATGEYERFLDALAAEGYVDANGDGVYSIQEGDPTADPQDDAKIEFLLDDGTKFTIDEWERIGAVCFVRGTRIVTARGEVAIEDLNPGDKVLTMDSGYQDIRWIGTTRVSGLKHMAPIRIKAGAFNNVRDVLVSPQHRILLKGGIVEMLYGESEALVAAKHLVDGEKVVIEERIEVDYFHMLFDDHQIVFAEGMPSESFHPGAVGLDALAEATRQEIFELFPELEEDLAAYGASCRTSLKAHEAVLAMNYGRTEERV